MCECDLDKSYNNSPVSMSEILLYSANPGKILFTVSAASLVMSYLAGYVLLYFLNSITAVVVIVNLSVDVGFMSVFRHRYYDLMRFDGVSHAFFYATTAVTFVASFFLLMVFLSSYVKNVFLLGLSTKICLWPIARVFGNIFFAFAVFWFMFVFDVGLSVAKYPGSRVFFTWVFFPLFSIAGSFMISFSFLNLAIIILKVFSGRVILRCSE